MYTFVFFNTEYILKKNIVIHSALTMKISENYDKRVTSLINCSVCRRKCVTENWFNACVCVCVCVCVCAHRPQTHEREPTGSASLWTGSGMWRNTSPRKHLSASNSIFKTHKNLEHGFHLIHLEKSRRGSFSSVSPFLKLRTRTECPECELSTHRTLSQNSSTDKSPPVTGSCPTSSW